MAKEVTALDLRKHFGEVLDDVRYRKEPYVVTRNGRPIIALIDIEAYRAVETQHKEEAFIEEYSNERVAEFLRADTLDRHIREHLTQRFRA